MAREQLHYQDYRPLHKGELGYSPTARRYISPSTGDIISVRTFQQHAHGGQRYEKRVAPEARTPRAPRQTYNGADLERLMKQPKQNLTPYQRQLVKQASVPQKLSDIARQTKIDPLTLLRATHNANLESTRIFFLRDRYVGYTSGGARKYLMRIQTRNGASVRWYTARGAAAILDDFQRETDYPELSTATITYVA